jgi:retron-type reverse transcriptase
VAKVEAVVAIGKVASKRVAELNSNNFDDRLNVNANNSENNDDRYSFGMALAPKTFRMKTHKNLYPKIYSVQNLVLAWKKARKGKTQKDYVIEFEEKLGRNLKLLHEELKTQTYEPKPLQTFILRDPKTRRISKSDFRDRIVHHAICNVIEPIFDKGFIYDSCANRKGKGNRLALERFEKFERKVTRNFTSYGYCLKADIKHYFQEVNHKILLKIIGRKIRDEKVIWLIESVIRERERERDARGIKNLNGRERVKGMPLGNLTSQFFANVYLNELDKFVKHNLKVKYYVRYVDDFVLLHPSKKQLEVWKERIGKFLREELKLELHPDKSKIISLSKGVDFVGFRNFYYFRLLRKRNLKNMKRKVESFSKGEISREKMAEIFQGWNAYAKWVNSYKVREKVFLKIIKHL